MASRRVLPPLKGEVPQCAHWGGGVSPVPRVLANRCVLPPPPGELRLRAASGRIPVTRRWRAVVKQARERQMRQGVQKRSRNFRSGRKTQANECAQRFSGTARRRWQRRVTPAADGRGSPRQSASPVPRRGGACPSRRPVPVSDKRAVEGASPYAANQGSRVIASQCRLASPSGGGGSGVSRPRLTEGVLRDNPHPPSPVGEGLSAL